MLKKSILLIFLASLFAGFGYSQNSVVPFLVTTEKKQQVIFQQNEFHQFGLDRFQYPEWEKHYDSPDSDYLPNYLISYKSVGFDIPDGVDAVIRNVRNFKSDSLVFKIADNNQRIRFIQKNDSVVSLFLPKKQTDYTINSFYRGRKIGALRVLVFELKTQKVIIVPLVKTTFNKDSLETKINLIYSQANVALDFSYLPKFSTKEFTNQTLFDNPSPSNDRYTNQMRAFRNSYFEAYPNADRRAFYVFIIAGFVDPEATGYMARNKAIAFVKTNSEEKLAVSIARELGFGIGILEDSWRNNGPAAGSTMNLMDQGFGVDLTADQWVKLRHSSSSFSFYDSDEDVRTNNGLVAYYFWKEGKDGTIQLEENDALKSIFRPYKKNYISYHLDIRDFFYQTIFTIGNYLINLWHLAIFVVLFTSAFLLRRRFHRYLTLKLKRPRLIKFFTRIVLFGFTCFVYWWSFLLINRGYENFEITAGIVKELKGKTKDQVSESLQFNQKMKRQNDGTLRSELLIQRNGNWFVKKRKKVLYFTVKQDENNQFYNLKYHKDSDSLILKKDSVSLKAESHYIIISFLDKKGTLLNQKVFNHLGIDLTKKRLVSNPAKRILLFVNGYRPTSIGHSFEENFKEIQSRGLEFPSTSNLIYSFDRYDYWRPWNELDLKFQKKINPSETFYADGHFSVSTSNHRSLVNFTTVSAMYPKRCSNRKNHSCYTVKKDRSWLFGDKVVQTYDLHRMKPNKKGFKKRFENGRIAGRNLLQIFNELPNKSKNDTLYIVAHSMGYAYSLGIIEELRGRIHFGGFYIIAPENASAGNVRLQEWKEVWQYGSNFNRGRADAPCLLDGVAPQVKVGGITQKQRAYIPLNLYQQKGFFDSHFVGYYTWIFDLEKNSAGFIPQR